MSKEKKKKTILVAEDDRASRKYYDVFLRHHGLNTLIAEDGKKAVDIFNKNDVDLILMDIRMPGFTGDEATKIIRQSKKSNKRRVPIIAVTAHAMSGDREKFIEAGMDDYLPKPTTPDDLLNVVRKFL